MTRRGADGNRPAPRSDGELNHGRAKLGASRRQPPDAAGRWQGRSERCPPARHERSAEAGSWQRARRVRRSGRQRQACSL